MKALNTTFWKFVVAFLAIVLMVLLATFLVGDYSANYGDQRAESGAR